MKGPGNAISVGNTMNHIHCNSKEKEILILNCEYGYVSKLLDTTSKLERSISEHIPRSQTKKEALVKVDSPVSNAIARTPYPLNRTSIKNDEQI